MRNVSASYPLIAELGVFLVTAIITVIYPSDYGFEQRAAPLLTEARDLLDRLELCNPNHPGVHHYRIHVLDSPLHASGALASARVYGSTAPGSSHANHMPCHTFLRLGAFAAAARANEASLSASLVIAAATGSRVDQHTTQFYAYTEIQLGRWQTAAGRVRDQLRLLDVPLQGQQMLGVGWQEGLDFAGYDPSLMPSRILCDTCDDPTKTDWMYQWSYMSYIGVLCSSGYVKCMDRWGG
jgi:hypothetical protein